MEIWKPIKDYEDLYEISNFGRIKSLERTVYNNSGKTKKKEKIMSLSKCTKGYYQVGLSRNGKRKVVLVHRIVALHFIENPNKYKQVNHINGIKTDNRIENLEWCNQSHNMKHAYKHGLKSTKGEKHPTNKLTKEQVLAIRSHGKVNAEKQRELAKKYKVKRSTIYAVLNRDSWKHI